MAKKRRIDLQFPLAGLHRGVARQKQPPYTTPDCCNVRPPDTIEGRWRGGSRPGLGKAYYTQLGSGNPVRLLAQVPVFFQDGAEVWEDHFEGSAIGDAWVAASWMTGAPGLINDDYSEVTYAASDGGMVRDALTSFDTAQAYTVGIFIVPYLGQHGGTYQIFARMDNTTPVATTGGIIAELVLNPTSGVYSGTLYSYAAGVATTTAFTGGTLSTRAGWFTITVTGNNVVVKWCGTTVLGSTAVSAAVGARIGFGMECTNTGGACLVDVFRVDYYCSTVLLRRKNLLVGSAGGLLYRELAGDWSGVTMGSLTLASDRRLYAVDRTQKLYIADVSDPRVFRTTGTVAGSILGDTNVTDWTALGILTADDICVITNGAGGTTDGNYAISSVHATNGVTLGSAPGNGTCTYRIERAPKVYDPKAGTLGLLTATAGFAPIGCPLVCRYLDCLMWAGGKAAPHLWYMSRQGNELDYDYSQTDAQRAVAGSNGETIGEPITAMMPHTDDYLIFGCTNSIWVMQGHPAWSGKIVNISHSVGIVDGGAICFGPQGELIFLSQDGLCVMAPGPNGFPQNLSRDKLPRELLDANIGTTTIHMAYDIRHRGVHIYLTPVDARQQMHWWFDWVSRGFWQVKLPTDLAPCSILEYAALTHDERTVLLGCRDGYVRRYRDTFETDDGTEIESYIVIGAIGDSVFQTFVQRLFGALDTSSGDVTWSILTGDTAEQAVQASAFVTGTWNSGLNYAAYASARAGYWCVKLENQDTNRAWAMENLSAIVEQAGPLSKH